MSWHALQSAHNRGAQRHLSESSRYADWEITALFYSAVHAVDEYLHSMGEKPCNHRARNRLVYKRMWHIRQDYYDLYSLCRRVRYEVPYTDVSREERQTAADLHGSILQKLQTSG